MSETKLISKSSKVCLAALFSFLLISGCGQGGTRAVNNPKNSAGLGPSAVVLTPTGTTVTPGDLTASGSYAILAKTGISTTGATAITGNIGVSPAAASYITGFNLTGPTTDSSNSIKFDDRDW